MSTSMTPVPSETGLFQNFRREMDSIMRRFFDSDVEMPISGEPGMLPRLNLAECDKNYEVTVDLPGVRPEDVKVELRDGNLWITGESKTEKEEKGRTWHRIERSSGQFRRVVSLGNKVNPEEIDAEYKDGVLTVTVGKSEETPTKRVEIRR